MTDSTAALSTDEFASLTEIGKGKAQSDVPQAHGERLVSLGYVIRRLGELELTSSGTRRLAAGQ